MQLFQEMNAIRAVQRIVSGHRKQPTLRCHSTHYRQMVVGLEDWQDGRFSTRSIGSDDGGQEIKARFVHKNKDSMLQARFFLHFRPNLFSPAGNLYFITLGGTFNRSLWCPI